MNSQRGFVEWVLILKILLVVGAAVYGTLLGVDTYSETNMPAPAAVSILHEGIVQSVEYGSWYQYKQIVTFQDGNKYALPSSCKAVQGAYLRIRTDDKAQTVICE